MSSLSNQNLENVDAAQWLDAHRRRFLHGLSQQGFARESLWRCERAISHFGTVIANRDIDGGQLGPKQITRLRTRALESAKPTLRNWMKFYLDRFIDDLVDAGVARRPVPKSQVMTALDRLGKEYEAYLRHQRGVSESTIYHYLHLFKRFMAFRFGERLGNLNDIKPDDIVTFLRELMQRRDKKPPTLLRSLFRFLFWSGKTRRDLTVCVPRVRHSRQSNLPRHLKPETIERLISAVRSDDAIGRRNYAMMLMIARLGLRAPELIGIRLDDIDWHAGEILIRGKGKRHDRMPLPHDVGSAIVDYIRRGRTGRSRVLFLSCRAPHAPFATARILNTILHSAFERTGIEPPQAYVGSHLLRHSLATDMLGKGAPLAEIGDVLRHRTMTSTTLYAARHQCAALDRA